jgi:PAS domain S-box-containing protein
METDVNNTCRWLNQAGKDFFGHDVLSEDATLWFDMAQDFYNKIQPLCEGANDTAEVELWQRRQDGENRLLSWRCRTLRDVAGKVTGVLSSARDITKRCQNERKIEALKDNYEMILQAAGEGIIVQGDDGRINFVNSAAAKMLGYSRAALIGRPGHATLHHSRQGGTLYPVTACPILQTCRAGKSFSSSDDMFFKRDGTSFPVEYTATPIAADGIFNGVVIIFRDVSQTKRLQESEVARIAADSANKAKSNFMANMSHELRTPLNAVIGFGEILQDQLFGNTNEKQLEYINDIVISGRHLLDLINDILDLSKVEAGKMELELDRVFLADILNNALAMIRDKAAQHSITLSAQLSPNADIEFVADERKLKQIMFNLLSNAVKFTEDGGSVSVQAHLTSASPAQIEINVSDTGIGIKPTDLKKLFQPFSQLESAYSKNFEGTGLGLALTKRLVDLHGGKIWAESEFGMGSKFTFLMPLRQPAQVEITSTGG